MMTSRQYFLVNMSKAIVELAGTAVLGIFYLTVGGQQTGLLLGYWIITLFAVAISGAHFNPCVTIAAMLRRNSNFGSRRLRGVIYIVAQFLGGMLAATLSIFLLNESRDTEGDVRCSQITVSPVIVQGENP